MINFDFQRLLDNVLDVTREMQIKVGVSDDCVSLYYPDRAIVNLLGKDYSDRKDAILKEFCEFAAKNEACISFSTDKFGRVCFKLDKKTVEFALADMSKCAFLKELVNFVVNCKNPEFRDIENLFKKFNCGAVVKRADDDEFNCLAYFPSGDPDDFIYCIDIEKDHVHYHRLTPMDFSDLYPWLKL
ncbi:MAG: DUF3877 family protein [Clostridia bacterium]|nr:DUF3877 family protein [Clostridia bacterium]